MKTGQGLSESARGGRVALRVPLSATVNRHFPVNAIALRVLELHDLMPFSCQFSPAARLLGVLFSGHILVQCCSSAIPKRETNRS